MKTTFIILIALWVWLILELKNAPWENKKGRTRRGEQEGENKMKTRNERIAEVMGWKLLDPEYNGIDSFDTDDAPGTLNLWSMEVAKLMQDKMVNDGWEVTIHHWKEELPDFPPKIYFSATTVNYGLGRDEFVDGDLEEVAIVELFCKVYEIKE